MSSSFDQGFMRTLFPCAEFHRLRQEYETALRVWGKYEFPPHDAPVGSVHLKQKALEARNAASDRIFKHKGKCRVCRIEESLQEWPGRHRPKAG